MIAENGILFLRAISATADASISTRSAEYILRIRCLSSAVVTMSVVTSTAPEPFSPSDSLVSKTSPVAAFTISLTRQTPPGTIAAAARRPIPPR